MEKAIPFSSSQPCGKAEYNEAKILPVLKQHSCSPTRIGERFSLCAFQQHPHGVPLVGDSGLWLEAQLFSVRRKMLPFIWFKYFLLHCYYHAFQAYTRISFLLLFLCQLSPKGTYESQEWRSSTILEGTHRLSSLFCWAQSSWHYSTNTVWTPKECRGGGGREAAVPYRMFAAGLHRTLLKVEANQLGGDHLPQEAHLHCCSCC